MEGAVRLGAVFLVFLASFLTVPQGSTEESDSPWGDHDPISTTRIDYEGWDIILKGIVFERNLIKKKITQQRPTTGTRIVRTQIVKKGWDYNYIPYRIVKEDFAQFLVALNYVLSDLQKIKVSSLNRNEQLAFWLNLRNALVLRTLFKHYPLTDKEMRALYFGNGKGEAVWDQTVISVEERPLSLRDIENIILRNWPDPRVLYGFFYGAKEGPFIMNTAFTGKNVYVLLEENAREFLSATFPIKISSREGVTVPAFYEWHLPIFGGKAGLLEHLKAYSNSSQKKALLGFGPDDLSFDFDWKLNDLTSRLGKDFVFTQMEMFTQGRFSNLPCTSACPGR